MKLSSSSFLRSSFFTATLAATWLIAAGGCDTSEANTDPRPVCPPGSPAECVGPTGGGSNPSGGSSSGNGGQGGSSATNDVTGKVGVLIDVAFSQVSAYAGASTVFTTSESGGPLQAPYGESTTSFSFLDVKAGPTWFFVQDETVGATGVYSTHSIVNIPVSGPVILPVVDRGVISSIAATLPTPIVLDGSKGLLILKVVRKGQPLAGVTLTTSLPGAEIVYDNGIGLYSNQSKLTGPAGVILALNVDGPSAGQLMDLTLTDVNQQSFFVPVRIQAGAATFAGYEL